MGRRVTSSTKGGRYMNPADQERKVTRRRELKKNKKQRQLVRQAVLKSKDPQQIIEEMEKLDKMEFDPHEEPPISERVIQEKRAKLRETYVRVMSMYKREDEDEQYEEIRKNLHEYDRRKMQMEQHYIAVKFTREVDPGDIPLPDAAPPLIDATGMPLLPFPPHMIMPGGFGTVPDSLMPGSIPSHFFGKPPAHGILKKKHKSLAPGVPVGPAPELSDDDDYEGDERRVKPKRAKEDLEDVDSGEEGELQTDEATTSETIAADKASSRVRFDDPDDNIDQDEKDTRTKYKQIAKRIAAGENIDDVIDDHSQTSLVPLHNAGFGMNQPPPMRALMRPVGPMMPPRPPQMPMPPLGFPPRPLQPGMRMLPPPPAFLRGAGFPPRMFPPIGPVPPMHPSTAVESSAIASGPVLSAPPTINKLAKAAAGPTIEAKPQLRNMQHEITKFVPTGVKIKQERGAAGGGATALSGGSSAAASAANKAKGGHIVFRVATTSSAQANQRAKLKTTDDAYEEFMNEMKELM